VYSSDRHLVCVYIVNVNRKDQNMLTINQLAQMENVTHKRRMPKDLVSLLDAKYFSKSKNAWVKIGDLSLPHFIRVLKSRKIETQNDQE